MPPSILPENPHLFYYVEVWYSIPFFRYLVNSVIVSAIVVAANVILNAMAGYALTKEFMGKRMIILLFLSCMMIPFQVTIIPAYLITKELGLLNTHFGMALPLCSTIVCIFIFKASFDAIPKSLIDAARIDGVPDWKQLDILIGEWQPARLVVGLPLNMDDSESEMSQRARRFGRRLEGRFHLPVDFVDERLSSFEAKQHLREQGHRGNYTKDPADSIAAELILRTWLESR